MTGPPDKREARKVAAFRASEKSSSCAVSDSSEFSETTASHTVKPIAANGCIDSTIPPCSEPPKFASAVDIAGIDSSQLQHPPIAFATVAKSCVANDIANATSGHATPTNASSNSFANDPFAKEKPHRVAITKGATGSSNCEANSAIESQPSANPLSAAAGQQLRTERAWDMLDRCGFEGTETENIQAPESVYLDICRTYSGETSAPDGYERMLADQAKLIRMSDEIACRLADGYHDPESGERISRNPWPQSTQPLWRYSALTKCKQRIPTYRNIRFLPFQAKMRRGPHLKFLEWWCTRHPFARMFVPTTGTRCCVTELRARIQELQRKTSKLNAKPWFKKHYEIVWRSTEIGTPEIDDAREWTFHPHAHIIVNQKHFIPPEQWAELRQRIKAHFGGHYFRESGKLVKPREACKYVIKPQEVLELDNKTLIELHDALFKLRLCQPLGSLKGSINHFREYRLKLVRPCKSNGWQWKSIKDWNRHADKVTGEDDKDDLDDVLDVAKTAPSNGGCAVIARIQPLPAASVVSEPCILVMGDIEAAEAEIRSDRRFRELVAAAEPAFRAGQMLQHISVHNTVVTVPPAQQRDLFTSRGIWEHPNSWHPPESFYRAQRVTYPPCAWDDGSNAADLREIEELERYGYAGIPHELDPAASEMTRGSVKPAVSSEMTLAGKSLTTLNPDIEKGRAKTATALLPLGCFYEEPWANRKVSQ